MRRSTPRIAALVGVLGLSLGALRARAGHAAGGPPATTNARVQADDLSEVRNHINWALNETSTCSQTMLCFGIVYWADIPIPPGKLPVTRQLTSARTMIIRAKAARLIGWNDYAYYAVYSTQIHNDGALALFNRRGDLVYQVLDELQINLSGRDLARELIVGTLFG